MVSWPMFFNRNIQTQRRVASTHAVVLMTMRGAFSFSGSTIQTCLILGTSFSTIGLEKDIHVSTSSGGFHPPNPLPMTAKEKHLATVRRLEEPLLCDCGDRVVINPENTLEFVCPNKHEVFSMAKCRFKEWLYGPKNQWPEEPRKVKKKEEKRVIYKAPPVMCECGVKSNYGLVPSELGIGHYCGHMVEYDESTRKCRWEYYDGQAKFLDKLKKRQVIAQKRGYGPDYVILFVKHHKEKMREFARQRSICNPIDVGLNKWKLERRMTLEEERTRNEAREETRVQMQVLNKHIVALCARIGCSEEHATELGRAGYEEKKLDEHRSQVGRTVQSPIMLSDEGGEDEDDTDRLSELIALAEAGLQA
ncbi:uncharacterized protein [Miscanthus floridulus]|uniref:uncharacterized protein n=1 Tax=Miscanthus floridulus TaxID=154761 RepID=UPI003458ADD7